jgi:hypothetical protein
MSSDRPSTDSATGERLYFEIYQRVAAKSDYMQPDGYRQMLPEAAITAGVVAVITGILTGIADGFLSKVGESIAEQAGRLLKRLKSDKPEAEQLVIVLAETIPLLRIQRMNWDEITALIAVDLTRQGMGFQISQEVARDIAASVQQELGRAR